MLVMLVLYILLPFIFNSDLFIHSETLLSKISCLYKSLIQPFASNLKRRKSQSWKSGWCGSYVQLCFGHLRRLVSFHLLSLRAVKLVLNWFWRYPQFWDQKNVLIPEFADKTSIWKPEPRNQCQPLKGDFTENTETLKNHLLTQI